MQLHEPKSEYRKQLSLASGLPCTQLSSRNVADLVQTKVTSAPPPHCWVSLVLTLQQQLKPVLPSSEATPFAPRDDDHGQLQSEVQLHPVAAQ
jgi:hypothetical protein